MNQWDTPDMNFEVEVFVWYREETLPVKFLDASPRELDLKLVR